MACRLAQARAESAGAVGQPRRVLGRAQQGFRPGGIPARSALGFTTVGPKGSLGLRSPASGVG